MNRKQRRIAARSGAKAGMPPPMAPLAMAPEAARDFDQAQKLHQAGRLAEADTLYRCVLDLDPENVQALHFLGLAAYQGGDLVTAEEFIGQAITLDPDYADAHNNLAAALRDQGRLDDAEAALRRAIELCPDMFSAHNNLGNLLVNQGRGDEAVALLRRAIQLNPGDADTNFNLGNAFMEQKKYKDAEASYGRALKLNPGMAVAHNNLATSLFRQDRLSEAEAQYRRAIALKPDYAEAHFNLANILKNIDKTEDAMVCYRQAIALKPDYAEAHLNLGTVLQTDRAWVEAEAHFRQALALGPDNASALNNLGSALAQQDKISDSRAAYEKAMVLDPDFAAPHFNLGNLLKGEGKISESIASYEKAIVLKADYADAYNNLGSALKDKGDVVASAVAFRSSLEIDPDNAKVHSNVIFLLDFDLDQDQQSHQKERRRWAERHARPLAERIRPHGNDPDPDRRLRVGYVSADFYHHSAARAFGPVVLGHDPADFEVVAYSSVSSEDENTGRFRAGVDQWRDVTKLSDSNLADLIRNDGIDILVDLSGHSSGNRLCAFAEAPAPVQVSAWGHGTGTGLKTMDYLLSDPVLIPPAERGLFAEEVIDLPSAFLFLPSADIPPVAPLPMLDNGFITFGCLNRREKLSKEFTDLISEILQSVPNSRLFLKARELSDDQVRDGLVCQLDAAGIDRRRYGLMGSTSQRGHLNAHNRIDIALDPFPQGGGISSTDALWMGVPVVTLRGRTVSSRNAASILTAVGLEGFIADTLDDYRDMAIAASEEIDKLNIIRTGLRQRAERSPLGDTTSYVKAVEAAYRDMWRRWCAGCQPIANVAE